jgi:ABC-2 type transport system ATP-binding protein
MTTILEFQDLNFFYRIRKSGLLVRRNKIENFPTFRSPLTGRISAGELIHLQGNNGIGKTTLLKLISGILIPSAGKVSNLARTICLLEDSVFHPELGLLENFSLFAGLHGINPQLPIRDFEANLKQHGNYGRQITSLGELSQGERCRFGLLCAISLNPQLLLLDEQTSHLDQHGRDWVWEFSKKFVASGGSILFTDHQIQGIGKRWNLTDSGLELAG